jgi:hypothetical protein
MKKLLSLLFAAAFAISAADAPRLNRLLITSAERSLDQRIQRMWSDNPTAVIGASRGVYLPGYGIVFSAEVNLVTANVSLMNPTMSEADKVAYRKKKLERIPQLRTAMKDILVGLAASLDPVPVTDKVSIAFVLPQFNWETGVPLQMVVEGVRSQLLAAQKAGPVAIDQAVKITETN